MAAQVRHAQHATAPCNIRGAMYGRRQTIKSHAPRPKQGAGTQPHLRAAGEHAVMQAKQGAAQRSGAP